MRTRRNIAIAFAVLHLAVFSIATIFASFEIESILASGWICLITGLLLCIVSAIAFRPLLAVAGILTILLTVAMVLLEAFVFQLGPGRATVPFCVTFFSWEILLLVITVRAILIHRRVSREETKFQFDIRFLMAITIVFAISFGVFSNAPRNPYPYAWLLQLVSVILSLVTLIVVSLAFFVESEWWIENLE